MDDKMKQEMMMKWKMGWETRKIGSTNFYCHWKKKAVGSGNLDSCGGAQRFLVLSNTTADRSSLTYEEHGIFPNPLHHYDLRSGFLYYCLTTMARSLTVVSHFTTWGTQSSCSEGERPSPGHCFYDKLSGPFLMTPKPARRVFVSWFICYFWSCYGCYMYWCSGEWIVHICSLQIKTVEMLSWKIWYPL